MISTNRFAGVKFAAVGAIISLHTSAYAGENPLRDIVDNQPDAALEKIEAGGKVKGKTRIGERALHWAARHNQEEVVSAILSRGVSPDVHNERKLTPLSAAIGFGSTESALQLIEKGADVNSRNKNGFSPVHFAALTGDVTLIEKLYKNGADIEAKIDGGASPLHLALYKGHEEAAATLLEYDANPKTQTDHGETALHWAVAGGAYELLKELESLGLNPNHQSLAGITPLHVAIALERDEAVELLLKSADPNSQDREGKTPLHYATALGRRDFVLALLDSGSGADIRDHYGWTPALIASRDDNQKMLEIFFNNGSEKIAFEPVRTSGSTSEASAKILQFLAMTSEDANAKTDYEASSLKHLQLAAQLYRQEAGEAHGRARGKAIGNFALNAASAAVAGAIDAKISELRSGGQARLYTQALALSEAEQSGTGVSGYYRALDALGKSSGTSAQLAYRPTIAWDQSVAAMSYRTQARYLDARAEAIEELLVMRDEEISESDSGPLSVDFVEPLEMQKEARPGGLGGIGQVYFCERRIPVELRSIIGTEYKLGGNVVVFDDIIEEIPPSPQLLWEVSVLPIPQTKEEKSCIASLFIRQCMVSMDWAKPSHIAGACD